MSAITGNDVIILNHGDYVSVYNYKNSDKKAGGLDKIYVDTGFGGVADITSMELKVDEKKVPNLTINIKGQYDSDRETVPSATIVLHNYTGTEPIYLGTLGTNAKGKIVASPVTQATYLGDTKNGGAISSVVGSTGNDTINVGRIGNSNVSFLYADGGKGADVFKIGELSGEEATLASFNNGKDAISFRNGEDNELTFNLKTYDSSYTYLGGENATLHYAELDEDGEATDVVRDVVLTGVGNTTKKVTSAIKVSSAKAAKGVVLNDQQDVVLAASPSNTNFDLRDWRNVTKTFNAAKVSAKNNLTVYANDSLTAYTSGKGNDNFYTARDEENSTVAASQVNYTYTGQAATATDNIYIRQATVKQGNKDVDAVKLDFGSNQIGSVSAEDNQVTINVVNAKNKSQGKLVINDATKDGGVFKYEYSLVESTVKGSGDSKAEDSDTIYATYTYSEYVTGAGLNRQQIGTTQVLDKQPISDKNDPSATKESVLAGLNSKWDTSTLTVTGQGKYAGDITSFGLEQYKDYIVNIAPDTDKKSYLDENNGDTDREEAKIVLRTTGNASGWSVGKVEYIGEDSEGKATLVETKDSTSDGTAAGAINDSVKGSHATVGGSDHLVTLGGGYWIDLDQTNNEVNNSGSAIKTPVVQYNYNADADHTTNFTISISTTDTIGASIVLGTTGTNVNNGISTTTLSTSVNFSTNANGTQSIPFGTGLPTFTLSYNYDDTNPDSPVATGIKTVMLGEVSATNSNGNTWTFSSSDIGGVADVDFTFTFTSAATSTIAVNGEIKNTVKTFTLGTFGTDSPAGDTYTILYGTDALGNSTNVITGAKKGGESSEGLNGGTTNTISNAITDLTNTDGTAAGTSNLTIHIDEAKGYVWYNVRKESASTDFYKGYSTSDKGTDSTKWDTLTLTYNVDKYGNELIKKGAAQATVNDGTTKTVTVTNSKFTLGTAQGMSTDNVEFTVDQTANSNKGTLAWTIENQLQTASATATFSTSDHWYEDYSDEEIAAAQAGFNSAIENILTPAPAADPSTAGGTTDPSNSGSTETTPGTYMERLFAEYGLTSLVESNNYAKSTDLSEVSKVSADITNDSLNLNQPQTAKLGDAILVSNKKSTK